MKRKSLLPPTYLLGAMALMAGLHFAWPVAKLVPSPWRYLGLVPLALGVLLNLWCDRLFHHARTTVDPFEQPSSLITGGPFRISRHPMYLGMVTLLAGLGAQLVIALLRTVQEGAGQYAGSVIAEAFGVAAYTALWSFPAHWLYLRARRVLGVTKRRRPGYGTL